MRDSFIFYRSFAEALAELPDADRLAMYDAIVAKSLNFEDTEFSGIKKSLFTLIKPQLEANNKRFINGTQPKHKQEISKTEAKEEQPRSKDAANNNVNDNVNDNVNEEIDKSISTANAEIKKSEIEKLFNSFWEAYKPVECDGRVVNKGSKSQSLDKFAKLVKSGYSVDLLIEKTKQYLTFCNANNQLTQSVPVFFNRKTYNDDFAVEVFMPEQSKYEPSTASAIKKLEVTEQERKAYAEALREPWGYKFNFMKSDQGIVVKKTGKLFEPTAQEVDAIGKFFADRGLKSFITAANNPEWVDIKKEPNNDCKKICY